LGASVTFWEATAPVKLPARHCPEPRSGAPLELKFSEAGIPLLAPPGLTPELHSLPAILYTLNPSPMPRCSKAPRGLSVLPRVTCIFTGIAVSPSICPRQRPTRYAIRAGRNLPDKEFRSNRSAIAEAIACPLGLHVATQIGPSLHPNVWDVRRMASEDSDHEPVSLSC
jgi:hypothetical protein